MPPRLFLACFIALFGFPALLAAQEPEPKRPAEALSVETPLQKEWWKCKYDEELFVLAFAPQANGRERLLYAFCQRGILESTGMGCLWWSHVGEDNPDFWIERRLLKLERFKQALAAAHDTSIYRATNPNKGAEGDEQKKIAASEVWGFYQRGGIDSERNQRNFTAVERAKLPGLYLRAEGMMTLCRPEFARLFDSPARQWEVKRMVAGRWEQIFEHLNRALWFTEKQQHFFLAAMRKQSVDLDCQIVLFLSDAERDRLVAVIERSRSFDNFFGPSTFSECDYYSEKEPTAK